MGGAAVSQVPRTLQLASRGHRFVSVVARVRGRDPWPGTYPPAPPVGGSLPSGEPELRFATDPGIRHLIAGTLTPAQAIKQNVVKIHKGNLKLLERFAQLFQIA